MAEKRPCTKCGTVLPVDSFDFKGLGRKGGRKDGRESQCRSCVNEGRRSKRICPGCGITYQHVGKSGSRRQVCDACVQVGRVCVRCKKFKPFERFYGDPSRKVGSYCKDGCALAQNREAKYGISSETHAALVAASADGCPICGNKGRRMALDHDHATGAFRDVICSKCNSAIGMMDDSIDTLLGAIAYLKKHSATRIK